MDPIKHLEDLERRAALGGGEDRLKKQHDAGKMTARERIEFLFDLGRSSRPTGWSRIAAAISAWTIPPC